MTVVTDAATDPEAMRSRLAEVSRRAEILAALNEARTQDELAGAVCRELCDAYDAEAAFVVVTRQSAGPRPEAICTLGLDEDAPARLARDRLCAGVLRSGHLRSERGEDLLGLGLRAVALVAADVSEGERVLVGIGTRRPMPEPCDPTLLEAVTRSTGHALERIWLAAELEHRAAREAALARAARALNAQLRPDKVLQTLCAEVAAALGADQAAVYSGEAVDLFMAVAGHGLPPAFLGYRPPEGGLVRSVLASGKPRVYNDYQGSGAKPTSTAFFDRIQAAAAVPMRRGGEVDGALVIGYEHEHWISREDVDLLRAFAELAVAACRNADQLVAAERAATLDSLTGCLNHASMQERVREEISRAERLGDPLTLVMLDLHAFKAVNETFGHLAGDTVLRTVGELLRNAVRRHDIVGRFGGDEFGLLLVDTREGEARQAVERIAMEIAAAPLPGDATVGVHVGIAAWQPGEQATRLIERADSAMRAAKRESRAIATASPAPAVAAPAATGKREGPDRRMRKLALAASIGSRLSRLIEPVAIAEAALEELRAALVCDACAVLRVEDGHAVAVASDPAPFAARPQDEGAVGACVREHRPVLVTDARRDPRYAGLAGDGAVSELAVPLYTGSDLYGAIDLRSSTRAAFDEEDADLVRTAADYLGAALRTAGLYAQLEASYMGAAEALAAALEAKDNYTADHARSIADLAVEVGRRLGLDDGERRDLRYGAIFHDIGKIAIPDAILNKPGPLTDEEYEIVKRHPLTGDQILAPIPFLANARRIVRHDHERWDGGGYPDGLAGEEIPLGARIVFVVDAYHAMVSDRPYRKGLGETAARAELLAHAGTQFDPRVVDALIECLEDGWRAD